MEAPEYLDLDEIDFSDDISFLALAGIVVSHLSLRTRKSPLESLMYTVSPAQ